MFLLLFAIYSFICRIFTVTKLHRCWSEKSFIRSVSFDVPTEKNSSSSLSIKRMRHGSRKFFLKFIYSCERKSHTQCGSGAINQTSLKSYLFTVIIIGQSILQQNREERKNSLRRQGIKFVHFLYVRAWSEHFKSEISTFVQSFLHVTNENYVHFMFMFGIRHASLLLNPI